jgi:predicted O-linked N-acetylglucosamine transferase (SPINDLY family)
LAGRLQDAGRTAEQPGGGSPGQDARPCEGSPGPGEINALVALFTEGRHAEAAALAQELAKRFPMHWAGWKMLGVAFQQMGRHADALAPMQKAAVLLPEDAETHNNLGIILQNLGRLTEAEASYRRALRIRPNYAQAHSNLGSTLQGMNRLDEAEASYRQALSIEPDYARAHCNLGAVLQHLGRLDEAEASLRRAVRIDPDDAEAHNNLGIVLKDMGRLDEAAASYRRALQIDPAYAEACCNLGSALQAQKRLDEAEASYRHTLAIKPDYAEAHCNLGLALRDMKRLDEAEASLRQALEIKPDFAEAYNNLGAVLKDADRLGEAEASYRRALAIKPDYADAHFNLGNVLFEQSRATEAVASFRQALEVKPDYVEAYCNLGVALKESGRLSEAEDSFRNVLKIAPDNTLARQNLANVLAYQSDFSEVVAESDAAMRLEGFTAVNWEQRLYFFSYHPDLSAREIYAEFVRWGNQFPDPVVDFSGHDRTPRRRLRVGYVSPDFRRHTSRFYFWPLFANHDRTAVELYAYSNVKPELEDDFTQKFKGVFEHWRDIRGVADSEVAQMVRQDGIDILVDACSHMRDERLGVFTLKPAPIQVTWLGAAWTTGLKMVDYALIDPYMAPEGTLTREAIVRLPHCFVAYCPPEETAEVTPSPCLKNGHITFGYTGRTERLNHHTFRVWGEILRQNPSARLILDFGPFADPPTQAHYREFMARHGMDSSRVTMRKSADIFAGLNDIDVLLDSFPHSGGTMLFDALWMGVPILTLASRPPVGRIGTSLMINLGLPEWVAESQEAYVAKAQALTRSFPALAQLRAGMRERMRNSPLMDGQGFARAVEKAYREMFEKWAGE